MIYLIKNAMLAFIFDIQYLSVCSFDEIMCSLYNKTMSPKRAVSLTLVAMKKGRSQPNDYSSVQRPVLLRHSELHLPPQLTLSQRN